MEDAAQLTQRRAEVDDDSGVGAARRLAMTCAAQAGADETQRATLGIVVTELATNLVRHAGRGTLLIQRVTTAREAMIEVQAMDQGPGIAAPERCLQDGYSTAGTAGTGLGAVQRLSDEFDLYSGAQGTVVLSRVAVTRRSAAARAQADAVRWGCTTREAPRERCNGDAWVVTQIAEGVGALVADGLGHGPLAAHAAGRAAALFEQTQDADLVRYLERAHAELAQTRGAALAVCRLDATCRRLAYLGVGNIAGTLVCADGARGLFTHNGIVGQVRPRLKMMEYDCPARGLLVMHSDGIKPQWRLDAYPGLLQRHPAVVAAVLSRDFRRGTDDSTVLVIGLDRTSAGTPPVQPH
ncbi:MAG: ATP-binding protein [Gammaproteobacteria bacterium]